MPLARPFPHESPLEVHAHIDAHGVLKTDAYAGDGILVGASILDSLDQLRAGITT
jgi:hypothetical protein